MKRIVLFFGLMLATITIALNASAAEVNGLNPMSDGLYTVFAMKPMYDTQTGDPIYWLVAGEGAVKDVSGERIYIEPTEYKIYTLPRGAFDEDFPSLESSQSVRISVNNGYAAPLFDAGSWGFVTIGGRNTTPPLVAN